MKYLEKPLTVEEINNIKNEDNYIEGNVLISISDMIDNDLDAFLDILSESLIGNVLLMDINYCAVGIVEGKDCDAGSVIMKVTGDVSQILE